MFSGQNIPFNISTTSNEIKVRPECGVLEKSTGTDVQCKIFDLSFKPRYL